MGRTTYSPYSLFQGYSDLNLSADLRVARFVGNTYTSQQSIAMMSAFRAIEICREEKFRLADIYDTKIPSSGGEIKDGYRPYIDIQENSVGYGHVPYDTYFACRNEIYLLGVLWRPVPASEVSTYAKDGKGAFRIEGFMMFSPNQGRMKVDDLVLEVDGNRIANSSELKAALANAKNKERIPAKVISDKKIQFVELKSADTTSQFLSEQDAFVKAVCDDYPGASDRPICGAKK